MENQRIEAMKQKLEGLNAKCCEIASGCLNPAKDSEWKRTNIQAREMKEEIEQEQRLEMETRFSVGDGVRWGAGTDCKAATVVRVTPKSVYAVEDECKLMNGVDSGEPDALKFSPGGFLGHTSGEQRYEFSPGTGRPIRFSQRTRRNGDVVYKMSGTGSASTGSMSSWGVLYKGRAKHHDYNF